MAGQDDEDINRIIQSTDYYEVLNISRDSTAVDIQLAYKTLALRCHPDKCDAPEATRAFQCIADAYTVLNDPFQRQQYDHGQITASPGPSISQAGCISANDLFLKVFTGYNNPSKMTINELITSNYDRLTRKLNGDAVCSTLLQNGLISQNTYENFKRKNSNSDLLDDMIRREKTKKKVLTFLEVLLEARQEHLLVKEEGEAWKDAEVHKWRIQWEKELNSDVLCPYLCHERIISETDYQCLNQQPSVQHRNRFLIDKLNCVSVQDFKKFLGLLNSVPGALLHSHSHPQKDWKSNLQAEMKGAAGDDEVESLASVLKEHYKWEFDKVRFLPWDDQDYCSLSDLYVSLVWARQYRKTAYLREEKLNHYTDVLSIPPGKKVKPRRVLVLGEPGIGKSTFSKKVCLDWAMEEEPALKQFKLVIPMFLRTHKPEDNIEETIYRELIPQDAGFSPAQIRRIIRKVGSKCLIILDGLDELFHQVCDIEKIIKKKVLVDVPFIITTRPVGRETGKYADVTAKILGFEPAGVDTYIQKFFVTPEMKQEESNCKFEGCINEIHKRGFEGMSQVPLLLHFLCLLYNTGNKLPQTMTGVYKRLEDYVRKRYECIKAENGEIITKDLIELALQNLMKLAYEGTLSGQLIFQTEKLKSKLTKPALELGFLSSWNISVDNEKRNQLTFVHKSFQDYFTANYIVNYPECLSDIRMYCRNKYKLLAMKMILSMCCGLSTSTGLVILKKIQDMNIMSEDVDVCSLQVECLCEVSEPVDISELKCYRYVSITQDHAPAHVEFHPTIIHVKDSCIHNVNTDSLRVSLKQEKQEHDPHGLKQRKPAQKTVKLNTDQLETIVMDQCQLNKQACHTLCDTIKQLSHHSNKTLELHVTDCGIEDISAIVRCATSTTHVHTLDMNWVAVDLSHALSGPVQSSGLHTLRLVNCKLSSTDVCALFSWPNVHQLTELNLSYNTLSNCLSAALSGPVQSSSLHVLSLCNCVLSLADVYALFSWSHVHQLTELNLSHNTLSNCLSTVLSGCQQEVSLRKLYLRDCGLRDEDVSALIQWIQFAPLLDQMNLQINFTSEKNLKQHLQDIIRTRNPDANVEY